MRFVPRLQKAAHRSARNDISAARRWRWMRMAMGRQEGDQPSMWVATQTLARSPGHAFYEKLNQVLEQSGFDRYVEELCAPHYAEQGPSSRRGCTSGCCSSGTSKGSTR